MSRFVDCSFIRRRIKPTGVRALLATMTSARKGIGIKVKIESAAVGVALTREMKRRVERAAQEVVDRIRASMEEHMDDQEHSSPGEPPYVKTDTLRQSITYQMTGKGTAVVGPDPDFVGFDDRGNAKVVGDYAELLEFGGGKIQPRPYMTPILGDISVSNKVLRIIKTGKR